MSWHWLDRVAATRAILRGTYPTTSHSCNWNTTRASATMARSPSQTEFVETVIEGFAAGAPAHHHLVFKAHPLEDGRTPLGRHPAGRAQPFGIGTGCISCAAANSRRCSTVRPRRSR
jgi:capsular polysaccharide export protein